MNSVLIGLVLLATGNRGFQAMVGQPADIAPSAYTYRASDPAKSPPESWIPVLYSAHLPLNHPFDHHSAAVKRCLTSVLWEEIRPVQTLELTWPIGAQQPSPSALHIQALVNRGASSSWWNNLDCTDLNLNPTISNNGRTYTYEIGLNTCGLIATVKGDAAQYASPEIQALAPDAWKSMDLDIEWGFDKPRADLDYSGRIEAYDGRIADVQPLNPETTVNQSSWSSKDPAKRRGIHLSLLYRGTSEWRKTQGYTTQADDVARTIVSVWTKSGNFSFLAADLENGPILAPEYGFWVRRTSQLNVGTGPMPILRTESHLLSEHVDSILGETRIKAWGTADCPWFGSNSTNQTVTVQGITFPPKTVAMHPGQHVDVVAEWRSPIDGTVQLQGMLTHAQAGGTGISWRVQADFGGIRGELSHGETDGTGSHRLESSTVHVHKGDVLSIAVGPRIDYRCCSTLVDWQISEVGGAARAWNLANDVAANPLASNPHADSFGNSGAWRFCSALPSSFDGPPAQPPIRQDSAATTAREFEAELKTRNLHTVREQVQTHPEQTWKAAVEATRGVDLPAVPEPPQRQEPPMQVDVPSKELTAQWKLAAWHLLRHCATNPTTGKLWFNDFPYGILAAETYLVLAVLDDMGEHDAAAAGFDQWLSLPLERDHPVGLFPDGQGALTYATGPDGYGGQMDGIHAFGPGSIGWALTQHYWMTGDKEWLRASEPRLVANAEWMLRQRQVLATVLPGGDRMWGKGLQPAMQVTPDSGGLWMNFYECEAYYWASVSRLAATIAVIDPATGNHLKAEAEKYRQDLRKAVERSIALSPVMPVRDGTFHSVIPFACYVRGPATGAWGWERDGSGAHVGPLYWDTVQTAAALISPAGLLPANDVRVQGYLDVLEDRFLFENANVGDRDWFARGWQYQGGLERQANMHLAADDIPVFLRSFLNCYAVDILPKDGYVFNEHAVHGPPDKIFEEAAFLERFRNLLVIEDGNRLWLDKGAPREWMAQGQHITVRHAPSRFGDVSFEIVSDVDNDRVTATVEMPTRIPGPVWLRVRHPSSKRIRSVTVNGRPWPAFDAGLEVVKLSGVTGRVQVEVRY